jgi:hypothetical protein
MTNFWMPNEPALLSLITDAGFDVVRHNAWGERTFVEARASDDPARLRRMEYAYAANVSNM